MDSKMNISAGKHGISLGFQLLIIAAVWLFTTGATTAGLYFGLKYRLDWQDREIERKAEKSEIAALQLADSQITARIERERSDWKEFASEIKGQLRDINSSLKQIVEDRSHEIRGKP